MTSRNLNDLRREYTHAGLRRADLLKDPIEQFAHWFKQTEDAGIQDPTAMTLATSSRDGQPSARTVLLKEFNQDGFVFYSNTCSRKGQDIHQNDKVGLLFTWLPLDRQVKIMGTASLLPQEEVNRYFNSRPKESQWAALASKQGEVITDRQSLDNAFQQIQKTYASGPVPVPAHWAGYRVTPASIEFWQGRENRLHDRFAFTLQNDKSWSLQRLSP